jgi:hypothetical protein
MKRIIIALAATALVAFVAVTSVAADPTWPPRPVRCPKQHVCVTWTYPQTNGTACFMTPFNARNYTGRPCK